MDLSTVPIDTPQGRILSTFLRDITERKQAERALEERTTYFETLLEDNPLGIVVIDDQGRVEMCNPAFEALFHYSQTEIKSRNLSDLIVPPELLPESRDLVRRVLSGHITSMTTRRRDGTLVDLEVHVSPLVIHGAVVGVIGLYQDITKRKRAEAKMAERHRLATLVAQVGTAPTGAENLRQGLQQCTEILVRDLDAASVRIWTLNKDENVLEIQASAGMRTHINGGHARIPVGKFIIGRIAESGEPHLSNLMREDSGVGDPEWARREGMVAFAGFPLKIEDRTMGVVAAFARHPLTEAVLQAFASVADSLAQFIERKRAEEALRLTQFSVEHTSDSVFWTDAQGHIVFVNEAACRSSGRSREELLSLSIPDVDPNYSKEGWGEFWEGFKPRGSITIESRYRTKQARVFPVEVNANYLEFDGNEYSFACVRDITERKEAEDALILERDKLEVVTQNIGAGLTIISRDYQIVWANKVTRDVYGDVVGRKCFEACNGLPVVCPHCGVREIFESGKNRVVCEQWGKNVQGNPVCVEIVATPIRDKDGNVVAALELVAPITERKHAEEARAFLASLVESTSDAIIGTTPEGIIASWNHGAEGLYGYSAEEMIGKYVSDLFPSERSDELAQYLDKISRGERISGFESVRVRNDSSRVDVALTISPVYDTAGKLLEL